MRGMLKQMALEKELETYLKHVSEWSEHEGKFVLIHGESVAGFYSTYEDALKEGYEKFGLDPFLVKQINALERVHFISRLVEPCLTSHGK